MNRLTHAECFLAAEFCVDPQNTVIPPLLMTGIGSR